MPGTAHEPGFASIGSLETISMTLGKTGIRCIFQFALVLLAPQGLSGDGKFYHRSEDIPAEIPYQRALIVFDGTRETLFLQSSFRFSGNQKEQTLGWVVPVPEVPDVASMKPEDANRLFGYLWKLTAPRVNKLRYEVGLVLFIVLIVLCSRIPIVNYWSTNHPVRFFLGIVILGILAAILIPAYNKIETSPEVRVVKAESVGAYDVQVIQSTASTALTAWLSENGFHFDGSDEKVFDGYIERGWKFVVAKANTGRDSGDDSVIAEGLVAPIILQFASENPVYPLALTATSGASTQLVIHTFAHQKMDCGQRLPVRGAVRNDQSFHETFNSFTVDVMPEGFFAEDDFTLPLFLTRFGGRLTPEEMRDDLLFTAAGDNESVQETFYEW